MNKALAYFTLGLLVICSSCVQPPNYPDEPTIEFLAFNKNVILQGSDNAPTDTLAINFSFQDGDGDLGFEQDSFDVFLTETETNFTTFFRLPMIPDQGIGNGISGIITVKMLNQVKNICCTVPNQPLPCLPSEEFPTDTISYLIQIKDRSGNLSNEVRTDVLTILCQ